MGINAEYMGLRLQSVIRMKLLVLLALHRLKHSRMLLRPLRLMLMLVCTAITTPTITTATMDSPGMCLDARGVMLKLALMLMPMLMLVCMGITTPTITMATMDSPGMCLDARGVTLKLRQRLMLMPDIMDSILIMVMEDPIATILDKQCVWRKILSDTLNSLSTTSNSTFFL